MNVTVERVENEATLKITAPAAEVNAGYKKAVKKIADQVNIPGFRKGKAPRAIIEMHYGKEAVKQEAFEIVANKAYSEALDQEKLIPVSDPKVEESVFEEGKDMELTIKVTLKPEPELGEYKGLHVDKKEVEITDEQVDAQIKDMMGRDAKMVVAEEGAVIEKGDFAIIDFAGTVDGEPFSGGEGKGYPLEVGSNSFIPGFEDQLVGLSKGDSTDVEVTFPEDYFVKDLAGKEAVFKVNIQDVKRKELPELNDEYVASKTDFKTVEELRANYKERMQKAAEANAKAEYEHELIDLAVANAKFSVPEIMIEDKISQMVEEMKMSLESRKMSLDMYMQYTGLDMAKIRENQRPVAEENVKTDLVLDAIAKAEDIQVDMADVDAEIAAISAQHGAAPEEVKKIIKGNGTMGLLLANILRRKAAHVVIDSAK
ncbi:trigger factor [Phascolarctobacterium succinatutens CAG:287]|mgnify:CR=1 FL=1|uniref:Trigger factor n=2 Tax=Phascolarctobacterium succinatutens TaxID=626940 RepID=R6WPP5_9FIRM|nr:trigger factor [Phascolarctobacterium succinatutens]CDD11335.1 trigger factor [Phascolarctobacterium succinatutens CAG:287]